MRCYEQFAGALSNFLKDTPIGMIGISHIRSYQTERSKSAGAHRINGEIQSVLKPVMREIGRWKHLAEVYRPLSVPKKQARKNMSEEQERCLLLVARDPSKPKRLLAGHCLIIMVNTGMGFGELRHLKRGDVFLDEEEPIIAVNEGTKSDFRIRTITINYSALSSMRWILKRWEKLGGSEPDQYILLHRATRTASQRAGRGHKRMSPPDFAQPMGHIYRAAREILKDAGLEGFVPYDMRSTFATKLLKDPAVSDQTFREIFGHSNTRTRDRYSRQ